MCRPILIRKGSDVHIAPARRLDLLGWTRFFFKEGINCSAAVVVVVCWYIDSCGFCVLFGGGKGNGVGWKREGRVGCFGKKKRYCRGREDAGLMTASHYRSATQVG